MSSDPGQPAEPFRGIEYPSLENSASSADPYPAVDYPEGQTPQWNRHAGLPPPVYPMPFGAPGYPGGYPYPSDPYHPYGPIKPPGTNGKAIAALVISVAGLLLCGLPSIAGLILGIMAMRETRRSGQDGFGLALAATIISGLVVGFWLLYWLAVVGLSATGWQFAP